MKRCEIMAQETLSGLITALEKGTKVHISVVFLSNYGNHMTRRTFAQSIHANPVCDEVKLLKGKEACVRCRNTVLRMCSRYQHSFGGLCPKGVYEYVRPVVKNGTTVAVVFVGNILMDDAQQRQLLRKYVKSSLFRTMAQDFTQEDCVHIANLVESYILFLLERYGDSAQEKYDSLIENIKAYVAENLTHDISMEELAAAFNYNEKYLGRRFKLSTGHSVSEYCNIRRIALAKKLLLQDNSKISDVAGKCGFNNVNYFNRIFKKITGKSPQKYRQTEK